MRFLKSYILILFIIFFASISYTDEFLDKNYALEYFKEGVMHFNNKEYEASIDFFRKSLGKVPNDSTVHFFLGMAYYRAGFEENALFEFNNVIENEQNDDMLINILKQFVNYLSMKQFAAREVKKSNDYAPSLEISGNPVGKYFLSKVTGVDVDDSGNIYAASFGSKLALKLSPEGKPLLPFTSPKITQGRLYDIAVNSLGSVYISDFTNDTVYTFHTDGKYIGSIGSSGFGDGEFYGPTGLAVDDDNNLYVIDSGNMRIVKFSVNGEFLLSFGREGDLDGEFSHPSGIAVDHTGKIYVADHGKKTIGVYDESGNFITNLKGIELTDPYGISFAETNKLIVSDRTSIKSYDIMHSTWTEINTGDRLSRVLDARIDQLGQLVVCDFDQDLILQFVPKEDKYRNLHVILNSVEAHSFPAIVYNVSVFDADGLPFYGLGLNNFLLRIGGGIVGKIDLSYNAVRDSRLNLLFLIDKSSAMEEYERDVENFIGVLLTKVSMEDEMAVIGFHNENWIASSFTNSKRRTMDAILEDRYETGKTFDSAFRRSVDYLNHRFYKKAIIVVTNSRLDESSFQTYSFQNCINYATNNSIPVYFLNFGERGNKRLGYFTRSTGGKVYDVYLSNELPYLYETIRSYRSPEYVIFFNDVYNSDLKYLYIESEVEVDFNGRFGRSRLGFIYP